MELEKVGLKAGLEIHQQLNTHKLFCNCDSELIDKEPDIEIERYLHAVKGESGEVDIAAKYEQEKNKKFIYKAYSDSICLIELDEEPPQKINQDALFTTLQISLLLNAKPLPVTQIMRKTVIDGSNTSGFQRTVLIAKDGFIETSQGKVRIDSIVLEEDSARIIKKEKDQTTYKLDRLGIPLIEIATYPDIKTPEQAKEAASKLGEILRSANVKRGIGTIRQDVNVSIKKGSRVEIKGFQDIKQMPNIILEEIKRQKAISEKGEKVSEEVRKALPNNKTEFLRPMPGKFRMYPETDLPLLKINRELIKKVKENLPKLKQEEQQDLEKIGVHKEVASQIIKDNLFQLFNELLQTKVNPDLIAKTITITTKTIASHNKIKTDKLTKEIYQEILEEFYKDKISKGAIEQILTEIAKGGDIKKSIKKYQLMGEKEIEKMIKNIISKNKDIKENKKALIGVVMKELKGKADGKKIIEILNKSN